SIASAEVSEVPDVPVQSLLRREPRHRPSAPRKLVFLFLGGSVADAGAWHARVGGDTRRRTRTLARERPHDGARRVQNVQGEGTARSGGKEVVDHGAGL